GEFCTLLVVECNSIGIGEAGLAIKVDQDGATFAYQLEHFQIATGRAVNHSGDFAIEEHAQRCLFLLFIFIRVTNQDGIAVGSCLILNTFDKRGEEVISNVGDDYSNGSGLLGTEGTGPAWLVITVTMDRG